MGSAIWNLNALRYNVSRHRRSDFRPSTVSISQAAARSSPGNSMNAANERASPWVMDLGGAECERGL